MSDSEEEFEEEIENEINTNEEETNDLRIHINDLEEWYFDMIFHKFNRDLNSVFIHWKSILKALSSIEQNSIQIGLYLKEINNSEKNNSKIYCYITNIKNIIYCLNELVDNLPLCIDYDLLINFIYTLGKVLENIRTLLHPFSHFQEKDNRIGKHLMKIFKAIEVIPILSKRLFNSIQLFSLPLKKISFLKRIFKSEILNLEEKYKELEDAESRSISFTSLSLKLNQLMDHFNQLKNDEILGKERELTEEIENNLMEIRSIISPFHRIFNQLIEKKKKDKKIFSAEDNAKLKEISFEFPLANSINPFDHISLVLFSDNFPILLSLAYSYSHVLSAKNQNLLLEVNNTFDMDNFISKLKNWANLSVQLQTHVTSFDYISKLKLFNSTKGELSTLSKKYDKLAQEVKNDCEQYQLFLNQFHVLQLNISKIVFIEFQVRIDIVL